MNRNPNDYVQVDLRRPVVNKHGKLMVVTLDPHGHGRTCDYWC
jgi:hypothetical protein